jgi:hypothetical protein
MGGVVDGDRDDGSDGSGSGSGSGWGGMTDPGFPGIPVPPFPGGDKCGCTYPTCQPGEALTCAGDNICGYPCFCERLLPPPTGECTSDLECGPDARCNVSECLPAPGCDANAPCPAVCYGKCEPNWASGCQSDAECGPGLACEVVCNDWGTTDPNGGTSSGGPMTTPDDMSGGGAPPSACVGACVPQGPSACRQTNADPAVMCEKPECADGQQLIPVGFDDQTCCEKFQCVSLCNATANGAMCEAPRCDNPRMGGIGPDCCPVFCCPSVNPDGTIGVECTGRTP